MAYTADQDWGAAVPDVLLRGDPGHEAHLHRMVAYRTARPDCEIFWMGSAWSRWQAVIHEAGDGMTIITRRTLGELMDKIESLG